jgi:hypothetical protein
MSCCLLCVSHDSPPWQGGVALSLPKGRGGRDSHMSTADACAGYLVNRVNLFRPLLINLLSRDMQISPDKNMSFPCTNAAFTLSLEPVGFARVVPARPGAKPSMRFLFVISHVCAPASFRPLLAETPLPSARTFVSIHNHEYHRFSYRGLTPH